MAGKSSGPWLWKERNQYVVNIRGKRHYLGPDREKAYDEWHRLSGEKEEVVAPTSVVALLDQFLDWCQKHRPDSYQWYSTRINEFAKRIQDLNVSKLKPFHVQQWIDTKKSDGHKRGCLIAVHRALNWAVKQGHIDKNPLRHMEKPAAGKREVVLSQEEFDAVLALASDQQFKDVLNFCWETGCRPQEIVRLEARHLELANNRCIFPEKESKGKKKKRVIYLTEGAKAIIERLVKQHPEGKLFRTRRSKGWTGNNVACRFQRIEKKLGKQYCLYNLRHSWMTRMLKAGNDPITVATLAGHNDVSTLARIYQHIQNDDGHLLKALKRGTSVSPPSTT